MSASRADGLEKDMEKIQHALRKEIDVVRKQVSNNTLEIKRNAQQIAENQAKIEDIQAQLDEANMLGFLDLLGPLGEALKGVSRVAKVVKILIKTKKLKATSKRSKGIFGEKVPAKLVFGRKKRKKRSIGRLFTRKKKSKPGKKPKTKKKPNAPDKKNVRKKETKRGGKESGSANIIDQLDRANGLSTMVKKETNTLKQGGGLLNNLKKLNPTSLLTKIWKPFKNLGKTIQAMMIAGAAAVTGLLGTVMCCCAKRQIRRRIMVAQQSTWRKQAEKGRIFGKSWTIKTKINFALGLQIVIAIGMITGISYWIKIDRENEGILRHGGRLAAVILTLFLIIIVLTIEMRATCLLKTSLRNPGVLHTGRSTPHPKQSVCEVLEILFLAIMLLVPIWITVLRELEAITFSSDIDVIISAVLPGMTTIGIIYILINRMKSSPCRKYLTKGRLQWHRDPMVETHQIQMKLLPQEFKADFEKFVQGSLET